MSKAIREIMLIARKQPSRAKGIVEHIPSHSLLRGIKEITHWIDLGNKNQRETACILLMKLAISILGDSLFPVITLDDHEKIIRKYFLS